MTLHLVMVGSTICTSTLSCQCHADQVVDKLSLSPLSKDVMQIIFLTHKHATSAALSPALLQLECALMLQEESSPAGD